MIDVRWLVFGAILGSGCAMFKGPTAESRKPKPVPISVASETTIAHPSVTGTLPANEIATKRRSEPGPAQSERWISLTELSSERVCIDVGSYVVAPGEKNPDLDFYIKEAQRGAIWVRSGTQERQLSVAEQAASRVLEKHPGTYTDYEQVESGRMTNECVKKLVNDYGTVVGCERYEERPMVETVEVQRQGMIVTRFGGARICTPNDGAVAADATTLEISFGGKVSLGQAMIHRIVLTGGRAVSGTWGATGGRSGLEPPTWAPGVGGARPSATTSAKPAATPEEEVLRHATAKVKLQAFKVVEPDGKVKFEFTADGKLMMSGSLVATYEPNGIIRKPDGRAFVALDANGVIWVHKGNNRVEEHAKIVGNSVELPATTFTYDNGRFSSTSRSKPRVNYASKFVPAIPAPLALFFIATQNPTRFSKQK